MNPNEVSPIGEGNDLLGNIFFCRASWPPLREMKFAHFTNASAARQILANRTLFLRSAASMNDAREVRHGIELLERASKDDGLNCVRDSFDALFNDRSSRFDKTLSRFLRSEGPHAAAERLLYSTFVGSLTEWDESVSPKGQLSMWRAYGRGAGTAIVVNGGLFEIDTSNDELWFFRVEYANDSEFNRIVQTLASQISSNSDGLKRIQAERLDDWLYAWLVWCACCIKDPFFNEEREWRLISWKRGTTDPTSVLNESGGRQTVSLLERGVRDFQGCPQEMLLLNLADDRIGFGKNIHRIFLRDGASARMSQNALKHELAMQWRDQIVPGTVDQLVEIASIPWRE